MNADLTAICDQLAALAARVELIERRDEQRGLIAHEMFTAGRESVRRAFGLPSETGQARRLRPVQPV